MARTSLTESRFCCAVVMVIGSALACSPPSFVNDSGVAISDAGVLDAGSTDSGVVDSGFDAGVVDSGIVDAGSFDAGAADAGAADAGVADAGVADAGVADAGVADAGVADAGTFDAGLADAGGFDAGSFDAGPGDAGLNCAAGFVGVSGGAPATVSGCRAITSPGTYTLSADLTDATFTPCINVHDTSDVRLDCAGHRVRAVKPVSVVNTTHFEMQNCQLEPTFVYAALAMSGSPSSALHDNILDGGDVNVDSSNGLHVFNNAFRATFNQTLTSDAQIACNQFESPYTDPATASTVVLLAFGGQNTFRDNTIDGKWDGVMPRRQVGSDDGLFINSEQGDVVTRNFIANNWDCGIETSGVVTSCEVSDNVITASWLCGIGGWYSSSLRSNTFSRNTIDSARRSFEFFRIGDLATGETAVFFQDNVFDSNRFINPYDVNTAAVHIPVYAQLGYAGTLTPPGVFIISGNVFRKNDFGVATPAPDFGNGTFIPGAIIDDGGNRCVVVADAGYPLSCAP